MQAYIFEHDQYYGAVAYGISLFNLINEVGDCNIPFLHVPFGDLNNIKKH